jgi:S-adenosylhomocysteine hydrolase
MPCGDLSKTWFLCCQHVLPTQTTLFDIFLEQWLKPENCFLLGKCYSTHPAAYDHFEDLGIQVDEKSKEFNNHISFDEQYKQYVESFFVETIKKLQTRQIEKIVCIDDGWTLLWVANKYMKIFPWLYEKLVTVEQTSSWYNMHAGNELHFPVINVARSEAKLVHESPHIAKLVVDKSREIISELQRKLPSNLLILGWGPIGHNISTLIERYNIECDIYDTKPHMSSISEEEFNKRLWSYEMIIWSTWTQSLNAKQVNQLKEDVVLTSASSSDREFDILHLRRKQERNNNPYHNVQVDGTTVMSQWFPITFYQNWHMPSVTAELTRCLMYAWVQQSIVWKNQKGFVGLHTATQSKIHEILQSHNL